MFNIISYFVCVCVCVCVRALSCVWLFATPWSIACQAPLSMEFSRREYWSELPFSTPGDPPDPGMDPMCLASPELAARFTVIYCCIPIRMAGEKLTPWGEGAYGEQQELSYINDKNFQWHGHLWKTVWSFLKKLKIKLPYGPARLKSGFPRDICIPIFIAALLTVSVEEWIINNGI